MDPSCRRPGIPRTQQARAPAERPSSSSLRPVADGCAGWRVAELVDSTHGQKQRFNPTLHPQPPTPHPPSVPLIRVGCLGFEWMRRSLDGELTGKRQCDEIPILLPNRPCRNSRDLPNRVPSCLTMPMRHWIQNLLRTATRWDLSGRKCNIPGAQMMSCIKHHQISLQLNKARFQISVNFLRDLKPIVVIQ